MKTKHTIRQTTQFPKFWDEEWLKIAINELDSRKMLPDEKANLEILIARNAEAVKAESRKIKEARVDENLAVKTATITNALALGIDIETIAKISDSTLEFVNAIKNKINLK